MIERPRSCPDCGDPGFGSHTGTYCQKCGWVLPEAIKTRVVSDTITIPRRDLEILVDAVKRYGDIMSESSGENLLDEDHEMRKYGFTHYVREWHVEDGEVVHDSPEGSGWLEYLGNLCDQYGKA